ncbi:uncharacterized protein LOC142645027 [Dermatophagoides pteronyssinus]|uniref:uncharacterized protein LOC142645027 n=1 Tax=Dermatophagoides pteronyssinus TaxID=6956 RepID=UPI003F662F28
MSAKKIGKKPKYPDPNIIDEYATAELQQRYDIDDEPSRGNEGDDEDDDDDDEDIERNDVDDDDDDDEVVVDEDPSSSLATGSGMISHGLVDPIIVDHDFNHSLARQRLSTIQNRMQNFETILAHLKCQLNDMHKHDNEMLKKVVTLNDEIAELNLIESYESSKLAATLTSTNSINNHQTENFSDLVLAAADYGHHSHHHPQHSHHHSIDSSYHMMKNTNY